MRAISITVGLALLVLVTGVVLKFGSGGAKEQPGPKVSQDGKNDEGEFVKNPFQAESGSSQPKLQIESNVFDFGIMKFPLVDGDDPDTELDGDSHTFVIKNVGDSVLKLAKGPSTCQCTMSELKGDVVEVPPGGSTDVTVVWKPEMIADPFEKAATIWTNDPALFAADSEFKDGKISLTVKGRVLNAVDIEPNSFSLGAIAEDRPTTFTGVVYSRSSADLTIAVKESNSEAMTAEIVPATPDELKQFTALSGWRFNGRLEPKLPIGQFRGSLVLSTNDSNVPTVTISVDAQRKGPVGIAGRFWNDAYSMVDFKNFDAAKGAETTLSVYVAKQAEPIEVKVAEVKPEGLLVTAERDANYTEPDRERFQVKVQVPPGRAPERLISKEAGVVRLETNIPDVPAIKFHIVYESR